MAGYPPQWEDFTMACSHYLVSSLDALLSILTLARTRYCGIVLSVFAILSAADQTVRLYRMSSHRDGCIKIRELLSKSNAKKRTGRLSPSMAQLYTWQMPVMFLTTAAICMIVGLFLHVWSAIRGLHHENWWSDDAKVSRSVMIFFDVAHEAGCCRIHCGRFNLDRPVFY